MTIIMALSKLIIDLVILAGTALAFVVVSIVWLLLSIIFWPVKHLFGMEDC